MGDTHVVGIDIGTTGAKAAVFGLDGGLVASAYSEYACTYPRPNWVEQDVDLIVGAAIDCCRKAVEQSGLGAGKIAAVSFSAQRCCSVFVDAAGRLVRPMISWQDNRAHEEAEEIGRKIPADEFYDITGMPLNTTWMVSKILWVRAHEPENWKRIAKVVQLQDYALKMMGAEEFFDDVSDAGFYGLWDPYAFDWSDRLLGLLGLDRSLFPKPSASGTRIGSVSAAAAARAGLKAGTPLCIGAGDQNSAAVGAGVVRKGYLSVSLGTGGLAAAYLDEPFRDPHRKAMVDNHAVYGKWQLEGLQAGAAGVFRWFRDEIAAMEKEAAASSGTNVYETLNADDRDDPARREGTGAPSLPRQRDHPAVEPARARDPAGAHLRPRQGLHGPRVHGRDHHGGARHGQLHGQRRHPDPAGQDPGRGHEVGGLEPDAGRRL